jgi:plastocyanin domain-containing protein
MKPTLPLIAILAALATSCKKQSNDAPPSPTATGGLSITVDGDGYHPESVSAPAGKPARLTFTRTSDEGCGQQLVFPALGLRKDLPLNEPVSVDVTMPESGSLAFTCGMDMYRGSVVVQ